MVFRIYTKTNNFIIEDFFYEDCTEGTGWNRKIVPSRVLDKISKIIAQCEDPNGFIVIGDNLIKLSEIICITH